MDEKLVGNPLPREPLSPAGLARRASMLGELDTAMARRNFRRRAVPIAAAASLALVAAVAFLVNPANRARNSPTPIAVKPPSASPARSMIQVVATDTSIARRLSASAPKSQRSPNIQTIDDDELQEMLRTTGQPDGLVRVGGRTRVASDLLPMPTDQDPSDAG